MAEAGDDLDAVLFAIGDHAAQLFEAPYGLIYLGEGDRIALWQSSRSKTYRDNAETSALAEVLRDRRVLRFDDQSTLGDEYAQSREAAIRLGLKSAVYVPLPTSGPPLGIKRVQARRRAVHR